MIVFSRMTRIRLGLRGEWSPAIISAGDRADPADVEHLLHPGGAQLFSRSFGLERMPSKAAFRSSLTR